MPYFFGDSMIYSLNYESPIGILFIESEDNKVIGIKYHMKKEKEYPNDFVFKVKKELEEYFNGKLTVFSFEINPKGTIFQQKVWKTLKTIPYGETKSYKEIAEYIGNPNAYRAVGNACHKNPILIAIPCHRVLGSNRSLTGFALGLSVKQQLLALEQKKF